MRVLVVQNFDNEGLGQIGAALVEAGADIDLRKPYNGEALPVHSGEHDAMVVLGGAQNALDDELCPYFPELLDLTRDFADRDRSVLGICLGSQLLARAFGGENQIGGATEFGWHQVSLTPAAKTDPVLAALPENFPIFEWHDDTFVLPQNAVRLAGSAVAENQAFRLGRAVYGFQFHFEADTPMVRDWSTSFASLIAERHPDWNGRLDGEITRNGSDADAAGLAIARAWVATI
ncbi:GMP synthase [Mesorhizobium sp. M4B.F.Ca.ET.190.01.1.1]|uniref:type 1 glutamine amidotransferase n=1 Tax=unclassified Mesorhizobium TaxID=325217 RepID=UPI000FD4207B|nr:MULTISPECIES: type 1 glutamine amidotransferase [unclassified Mesorhizobium]RVC61195.1 GMP synthase [Mesorhizobium sp. M4B.F.Ca.ET.088.02.2.1]RWF26398.1 MAG: GMP synthase [Mesorhizobium sp.]RWF38572.1 MAG: GMP synthase [Mesorhizobium sp.]RWF61735.1 MAG: GMP synthase [Mesorhizobium sp.]TGQ34557.1 GMP synthase [Mesorhizobium sp. M4B.F.Ca.ET.214.01.1.1]